MSKNLKIKQMIFGDQGIIFAVESDADHKILLYSTSELFRNDSLLAEFSPTDIRLISYYAAAEEFAADSRFLKNQLN